jgi:hypothetical protein
MIKTLLQARPQIISNLKRKLIGHIYVLQASYNQIKKKNVMENKTTLLSKIIAEVNLKSFIYIKLWEPWIQREKKKKLTSMSP